MIENEKETSGSVSAWQWWFGDVFWVSVTEWVCHVLVCLAKHNICRLHITSSCRAACGCFLGWRFLKTVSHSNHHRCATQNRRCLDETMSRLQSNRRIRHNCEELKFSCHFLWSEFLIPRGNRLVTMAVARSSQLIIEYASRKMECKPKLQKSSLR